MAQAVEKHSDRYFIHQAVTWEQFKALQSAFAEISGVRLMYCEGVLEIMGLGILHEMIVTLLGGLLMTYFSLRRIGFISTGSYSQIVEPSTEFQADLSYSFSSDREATDLCIEVVVTSGSTKKLRKYQLRNIPEVWFWEEGKISLYVLRDGEYMQTEKSLFLPDLDLGHLEQCLLMDSHLDAMLAFREKYE
jgi:Uma2 family endonuclease